METTNSDENKVEDTVEELDLDEQAYELDFDDDLGEEDEELEDDVEDEESLEEELNEIFGYVEVDRTKLKYVMYLRKSTEDEGKQTCSIKDQKKVCLDCIKRLGIKIDEKDIIEEEMSARHPNNRPKFTKMMKAIKKGEYDGIIAYHPDRLSRNMLEAGEILNMLKPNRKKEVILKDLVFPATAFHNDSSGRLMLAVLFSIATQYSDHLQEQVTRGVKSHFRAGKSSGAHKWGYKRSPKGYYVPDKTFAHVRKCWEMALDGKTYEEILQYAEDNDISYMTKETEKKNSKKVSLASKGQLSHMFHDPFYYGMLLQAGKKRYLLKVQPDFKRIVTRREWETLQAILDEKYTLREKPKNDDAPFIPFQGLVYCECGSKMHGYASKGKPGSKIRTIRFDCQNTKDCTRKVGAKKNGVTVSVRGQVIYDQLCDELKHLKLSKEAYDEYDEAVEDFIKMETDKLNKMSLNLNARLLNVKAAYKAELADLKNLTLSKALPVLIDESEKRVQKLDDRVQKLEAELDEVRDKLQDEDEVRMTKEEFFRFLETAHLQMRNGDFEQKDLIAKTLFSKLYIDHKNRLTVLWKPEFDGLISSPNMHNVLNGDPIGTVIEPPEKVARVLYMLASDYDYSIPEIPPETIKEASKNIDYIL